MDVKVNYICGICQKAFTKNSSLKRHKANVHLSTRYNCLTCPKTYKRREDMIKHSKKCLINKLNEGCEENQPPMDHPSTSREVPNNAPSNAITDVIQDLTVSDSEDEEVAAMASKIESKLIGNTVSRQTNTDISNISTCDKSTNTEPLIVITPDEILELGQKLSLLTFDKSLKIFVDTLNSDIVFCKPDLARKASPTTQISLLTAQPTVNRSSQTNKNTPVGANQDHLLHMPCLDFHSTLEDP